MIAVWLAMAAAAIPEGVRPAAAPPDILALHRAANPDAAAPVCAPLWKEHVHLCFKVQEGKRLRWVTAADLTRWKTDLDTLRARLRDEGQPRARAGLEAHTVEGMQPGPGADYLLLRDGAGWAASSLISPVALQERLGEGRFRVAIPRAGVLVAWPDPARSGANPKVGAELDHILSVAVREMYDAATDSVSPMVHAWDGKRFVPFAEARAQEKKP